MKLVFFDPSLLNLNKNKKWIYHKKNGSVNWKVMTMLFCLMSELCKNSKKDTSPVLHCWTSAKPPVLWKGFNQ